MIVSEGLVPAEFTACTCIRCLLPTASFVTFTPLASGTPGCTVFQPDHFLPALRIR